MKKELDMESMLTKLRIKKLDPAIEDACHNKLVNYFANLEAKEEITKRTPIKKWMSYAAACVVVVGLLFISTIFYQAQITKGTIKAMEVVQRLAPYESPISIAVNFFAQKSTVRLLKKEITVNLTTNEIVKEVYPIIIDLSDEEIELTKNILTKEPILYDFFTTFDEERNSIIYYFGISKEFGDPRDMWDRLGIEEKGGCTPITMFYPTDPIISIKGYQYPDENLKYVLVEFKPFKQSDSKYHFYLIVDLDKQIISGPAFDIIESTIEKN